MNAPLAKRVPHELVKHGHTRQDDYYWLNKREDPEVISYLEKENAYTEAQMADTKALRDKLFLELKGRIKEADSSAPYFKNGYFYYTRFEEGQEYPLYCRKKGSLDAKEELFLDVNELAKGHDYYQVGGLAVSFDNTKLIFGVDAVSRRQYTLFLKDLATGKITPLGIENTTGGATWATDNQTFFYTRNDSETLRAHQIWRATLQKPDAAQLVYEEKDDTFTVAAGLSRSKKFIIVLSESTVSAEARSIPADQPTSEPSLLQKRERGHEYSVDHWNGRFYIRTNWKAKNFRVMSTDEKNTSKENWKEEVAHRDDVFLEGFELFSKHFVTEEKKDGLTRLAVSTWAERAKIHHVSFDDPTYDAGLGINAEGDTTELRFTYSSLTTPDSVFAYDMDKRTKTLVKQKEVLGGFDKNQYVSERAWAKARDGTKVPVSLVYRKGFERNGQAPLLLYAYGSYGMAMPAYFSSGRISLLDRGFVFAIAHIRGGQELGRAWYEDGKLKKKKNSFYDYIDCAEFLIKENYTSKEKLFAMGGSAGGLLMGGVVNMRGDLFRGVVAQVPFVDVMTTMLDDSLPLTTLEYDEWGNPNDKDSYDYMLSYSPYDNVEKKAYPNMLVTTGLHDSQVQYFEPAKWVAKLRTHKTDANLLLLKTEMSAGHGGKSGRFQALEETAFEYAFLLKLAGVNQ